MPTNRRDFLKKTAAASGAALGFGGLAPARALGASDRLRVGVLGSGQRAQYLMSLFNKASDVEIVAVCDVYEPHREKALESAAKDAQGTGEYREVLDRKDVDAVIIGAPDHWHKKMLLDAVQAGKDVYCEKPVMHSIPEGLEIVRAVGASGRVVQIGMQQRSWDHYKLGKEIVDSGKLGKVTFVHTYWYQNYSARAERVALAAVDQSKLDWKKFLGDAPDQPYSNEKFIWWRFYWDFGGGILTDLLTHWIDVIQWYMGEPAPKTAATTGDRYLMNWQCPDTITTAFEYPGSFTVTFTGALAGGVDDGGIEFRGTEATLKIDRTRLAVYPEGVRWAPGTQAPEPEIIARSEHDGTLDHVQNFVDSVRSRKTPNAPVQIGFEAARASWIGNLALERGKRISWNAARNQIES